MVLTLMRSRVVRIVYLVTVLALLAAALADQSGTLWNEVQRLSAPVVVGAFVAGLFGLLCTMMVWRAALAGLGSRLSIPEAWRIIFLGQLGKYVPGEHLAGARPERARRRPWHTPAPIGGVGAARICRRHVQRPGGRLCDVAVRGGFVRALLLGALHPPCGRGPAVPSGAQSPAGAAAQADPPACAGKAGRHRRPWPEPWGGRSPAGRSME